MQMDLMAMDKGKGKPVFLQALTRDKVGLDNGGGGGGGALVSCKEDFGGMMIFFGNNSRRCTAWGAAGLILPFIYNKDLC